MKRQILKVQFLLVVLFFVQAVLASGQEAKLQSGTIISIKQGVFYSKGLPCKIASVQTDEGKVDVAIPSTGMSSVSVGENIFFQGQEVIMGTNKVIAAGGTGYLYRENEKSAAEMMEEMQKQAMTRFNTNDLAANAVPIQVMESKSQKQEKQREESEAARDRNIDRMFTIVSIVLALLALEKVPKLIIWARDIFKKSFGRTRSN